MRKLCIVLAAFFLTATAANAETFCFDEAGAAYGISPLILRAIAKVESNYNPEAINKNRNGSYDYGIMQINSIWASTLGKERWNNLGDPCSNIKTGAMILSGCMKKYGYSWQAIGCYNSQTPGKSERYARLVFKEVQRIQKGAGTDAVANDAAPAVVKNASYPHPTQGVAAVPNGSEEAAIGLDASTVFEVQQPVVN